MTAAAGRRPGAAGTIAWAAGRAGLFLPVRVRAWDGSESGPADTPTMVLRSPLALRRIVWRPGQLGLARAFISGDLDVEGDLTEGLRRARRAVTGTRPGWGPARWAEAASASALAAARLGVFGPPPARPACELRHSGRPHSRARDRAVVAGHYDLPVLFFRLILDPSMAYSCGYAPGGGAFIESYVAADMHMRPVGETLGLLEQAGLEVLGVESLRPHYVRTIRAWLDNLERNLTAVQAVIGAERARMWRLYLAGGALAFEEGRMGVDQILAARRG